MAKIALDLDGVVADFPGRLLDIYNSRYTPGLKPEDLNRYDFTALFDPPISTNLIEIFNEPGFFLDLELLSGAKETIHALLAKNYVIEICTAPPHTRNPLAVVEKLDWVAKHFPELEGSVTVTSNKFYMATNMLVDDHMTNIELWCEMHPEGIGYLINQHWNLHITELPVNAVRGPLTRVPEFLDKFFCFDREKFAYRIDELAPWKRL